MKIACAKCNGAGYINHYTDSGVWSEYCKACDGKGILGDIIIDDLVEEGVYLSKKEYEELLEYKHMYESLCK